MLFLNEPAAYEVTHQKVFRIRLILAWELAPSKYSDGLGDVECTFIDFR